MQQQPANTTPVFEVQKLSKTYLLPGRLLCHPKNQKEPQEKVVKALHKVSFTLTPGLYGLLGPNGAGKSTLLNIITGSLAADSGQVLWNGKNSLRLGKQFRAVLGYMPQQQGLYNSFTGRRFLRYLCALKEVPKAKTEEQVEKAAAAVNLTTELDKRLSAYSGGMKQRLLAAGTLLGDPKLLVLDEPTAGLDPKERVRLRQLMAGMAQERIVIIATHVVSDVESVARQVLLLKQGVLADMAPPEQLVEKYAPGGGLEDVYLAVFGGEEQQ